MIFRDISGIFLSPKESRKARTTGGGDSEESPITPRLNIKTCVLPGACLSWTGSVALNGQVMRLFSPRGIKRPSPRLVAAGFWQYHDRFCYITHTVRVISHRKMHREKDFVPTFNLDFIGCGEHVAAERLSNGSTAELRAS